MKDLPDLIKNQPDAKLSEDGFTARELGEDLSRDMSPTPRPCRRCTVEWTPSSWNFYDLCEACFIEFNQQKMAGRFGGGPRFESALEWIKATKGGVVVSEHSSSARMQRLATAYHKAMRSATEAESPDGTVHTVEVIYAMAAVLANLFRTAKPDSSYGDLEQFLVNVWNEKGGEPECFGVFCSCKQAANDEPKRGQT